MPLPPIWNGTLREHYVLLFSAAGAIATLAGSAAAWLGAQVGGRRVAREAATEAVRSIEGVTQHQLAALQHAVEAMAVEVERIGEAQRFSARLLAERAPGREVRPLTPRGGSQIPTPH